MISVMGKGVINLAKAMEHLDLTYFELQGSYAYIYEYIFFSPSVYFKTNLTTIFFDKSNTLINDEVVGAFLHSLRARRKLETLKLKLKLKHLSKEKPYLKINLEGFF